MKDKKFLELGILQLYHDGLLAYDDTLYMLDSMFRARHGFIGARSYRDANGLLCVDFPGCSVTYPGSI